jgi:transposase
MHPMCEEKECILLSTMKQISKNIENDIINNLQNGLSNRETAKRADVSHATVNRIAKKAFPRRVVERKGRPPKLTLRDKHYCVRQITMGGKETAVDVKRSLENDIGVSVCNNTVRNVLRDMGIGSIVKPKKPYLSPKNVKERLAWARAHVDWTLDDWRRVVWSDETKINRFGSDGHRYAWKRDYEQLQPKHVQQTVKHGGGSIKLWSCITYDGVGYIVKIGDTLDKDLYLSILKEDLQATVDEYGVDQEKMIFQHDNDPKHTAGIVKEWLSNQPFEVIKWPAQSPDLSPIENMWALLKLKLYRDYDRPPKGMNEHWERIHETWYKITKEECQKVIGTMPERCKRVIKAKGYWIDY